MNTVSLKGYTLVELLVVISIVIVFSSIVFIGYSRFQINARDTKRIADLQQVRQALQFYFNKNGMYPVQNTYSIHSGSSNTWIPNLDAYLLQLPTDPLNSPPAPFHRLGQGYTYLYYSRDGSSYNLIANLENPNHSEACIHKCWKFTDDDGSGRIGQAWCEAQVPSCDNGDAIVPNFSPKLYVDHQ